MRRIASRRVASRRSALPARAPPAAAPGWGARRGLGPRGRPCLYPEGCGRLQAARAAPAAGSSQRGGPALAPPARPRPRPPHRAGPATGAATRGVSFGAMAAPAVPLGPSERYRAWGGAGEGGGPGWSLAGGMCVGVGGSARCEVRENPAKRLELPASRSARRAGGNGRLVLVTAMLRLNLIPLKNKKKGNCWSLNTYLTTLIGILFEVLIQSRRSGLPIVVGILYTLSWVPTTPGERLQHELCE